MGVAFTALVIALGGTAVALPGSNGVNSGDVKNNSLTSKDVKNNSLTGKDIRNGRVAGADVKNNGLTGTDVNEGSLGKVPSSAAADTAGFAANAGTVGGRTVQRIAVLVPDEAPATTILNINGLVLTGTCDGNNWDITGTSTVQNAAVYFWGIDTDSDTVDGDDFEGGDFDIGEEIDLVGNTGDGDGDTSQGQIDYVQANAANGVNVQYVLDEVDGGCLFIGTAVS
jgi:hypothetical protein